MIGTVRRPMSALPPKADITQLAAPKVRIASKSGLMQCSKQTRYSISSSAWRRNAA